MSDLLNDLVGRLSDAPCWDDSTIPQTIEGPRTIRWNSRAGCWRRTSLEPREQSFRSGPPRRRIAPASLCVVQAGELLIPRREGVRVVESVDDLDGAEQLFLRLGPIAPLREHEAEVRPRGRYGEGIADRVGKGEGALRTRRRFLDGLHAEEAVDGVRQRIRGEADFAGGERDVRGSSEGLRGRSRVSLATHHNPEIDLDRRILPGGPPNRRGRLEESGLRTRDIVTGDQGDTQIRQCANSFPGAVRQDIRGAA